MTDGYIIATNMPIVKPLYFLSIVTYLSEREQLSIFCCYVAKLSAHFGLLD